MPYNEITGKPPFNEFLKNDVRIIEPDLGASLGAVVNLCHEHGVLE